MSRFSLHEHLKSQYCYLDSTIGFPLLVHYALSRCKPRKPKRLYNQLPAMMELLIREYWKHNK